MTRARGWSLAVESARLNGCVVLVVEDEPLVGLELVETLTANGAHAVSAGRLADAIRAVDQHRISVAILDIKLGGEDCSLLCQYLSQRQIRFVFYTGYTTPPDGWSDVPIINKPAHRAHIVDTIERLRGSHEQAA
jgi:CheY-like chemotaxis protein